MTKRNLLTKGALAIGALFLPLSAAGSQIDLNKWQYFVMGERGKGILTPTYWIKEKRQDVFRGMLESCLKYKRNPFNCYLYSDLEGSERLPLTFQQVKELWGFNDKHDDFIWLQNKGGIYTIYSYGSNEGTVAYSPNNSPAKYYRYWNGKFTCSE